MVLCKPYRLRSTKHDDRYLSHYTNANSNLRFLLLEMMKEATGEEPVLWSSSVIGFGNKRFKSPATGREVDWLVIGFSPRKANLSLYLELNFNKQEAALEKLGKHKTGVGCLYINKLEEIDLEVLKEMIDASVNQSKNR